MGAFLKKHRNDLLLVSAILLIACVAGGLLLLFRNPGDMVTVTVDGQKLGQYPLETNREIPISTPYGQNLLLIQNGAVSVKQADCDNQICVHTGEIRYEGQTIVCLPHRLVIRITN